MIEVDAQRNRPAPWDKRLFGGGFVGFGVGITASMMLEELRGPGTLPAALAVAAFVALLVGVGAVVRSAMRKPETVALRVDERGLTIGGELVPRSSIRNAYVVPQTEKNPTKLVVGTTSVMLSDDATAERILTELGVGSDQRVATFEAVSPIARGGKYLFAWMLATFAIGTALVMLFAAPWIFFVAAVLACVAPFVFINEKLHVGTDGMRIASRIGEQFIAWDEVERVEPTAQGARLITKTGVVRLPVTARFSTFYAYEKELQAALIARIQHALTAFRSGPEASAEALLSRGQRDAREWLASLRQRGGFRDASLTPEALVRVAESRVAEPTARAAAAALLSPNADDAMRARLRVAADACASPKLRVALEKAADAAGEQDLDDAVVEASEQA